MEVRCDMDSCLWRWTLDGDLEQLESTLKEKKDIDITKVVIDGFPLLHVAAQRGHKNIISLFLDNGASPNHLNSTKHTALHFACFEGHLVEDCFFSFFFNSCCLGMCKTSRSKWMPSK